MSRLCFAAVNAFGMETNRRTSPASDKMNQLQSIPFAQGNLTPPGARNDLSVMFNRHTVTLDSECADKLFEIGRRRELIECPGLPIENQCKCHTFSA
jgi:hypothetical protein